MEVLRSTTEGQWTLLRKHSHFLFTEPCEADNMRRNRSAEKLAVPQSGTAGERDMGSSVSLLINPTLF